jgi:UDP-glucose 4-epimerase
MKVAVLGGSGFLGSHVADQLTKDGHEVIVFDRVESQWLLPSQKMVTGSILDEELLIKSLEGCDAVYHLAALSDLNDTLDKPVETAEINVLGAVKVLNTCRKLGVKRFIYASTIYVYSREGGFYRCSKQAAEHYVEEFQREYGLDFTILRYGSLYGPRSDQSNGLYRVIKNALNEGKITYKGSSEAMREYIHVDDAAKASVVALGESFKNESVILTGQRSMKVVDVLKMVAEILNFPSEIDFVDSEYVGHYIRSPYAYQPKLGRTYTPPLYVDLGQGILQLIEEIQHERKANS